jgi:hypothetical protein
MYSAPFSRSCSPRNSKIGSTGAGLPPSGATSCAISTDCRLEQDGKRFLLRTPTIGVAGKLFQVVGVALPPSVQELPLPASQSPAQPRRQHRCRGVKTASLSRQGLNLFIFLPIDV